VNEFDKVADLMENPNKIMFGSTMLDSSNGFKNRREYFSRVYGRVESIRSLIWDEPATIAKKQDVVERANYVMARRRPNFPYKLF
jgi:hypothetical protein